MSEDLYSWTITDAVFSSGPIHFALHVLAVGVAIYVVFRALSARFRHTPFPTVRFVFLSFLPLVAASLGVYICLVVIRSVYFTSGLVDPGAMPAGIASARLFLVSGWLWTTLSLLSVYAASRPKIAEPAS